LRIELHSAGEWRRFAACGRNRVQVAEQVEDDRLPVRRDVDGEPRALVGVYRDVPRGIQWEVAVATLLACGNGASRILGRDRHGRAERGREHQGCENDTA